jgi:hypothetical protein
MACKRCSQLEYGPTSFEHECKENPMTHQSACHHFVVENVMETPYQKLVVSCDVSIVAQHQQ